MCIVPLHVPWKWNDAGLPQFRHTGEKFKANQEFKTVNLDDGTLEISV